MVFTLGFSQDGTILASGSADGTVILWDVANHQPVGPPLTRQRPRQAQSDDFGAWVTSVAFSPNGEMLASGYQDGTILLWDVVRREPAGFPLMSQHHWVYSLAFSPDGKNLTSGHVDKTVVLWDIAGGQTLGVTLGRHSDRVSSLAFSLDSKRMTSVSLDGTVTSWEVSNRKSLDSDFTGSTSSGATISPNGMTVAVGNQDGTILLWDVINRQLVGLPLTGHHDSVTSLAFSPDSKTLASGSCAELVSNRCTKGEIRLWDVSSGLPIGPALFNHNGTVRNVVFSPDGKLLATVGWDMTIILWDVGTRQPIGPPHDVPNVQSVKFSPDSKTLAIGTGSSEVFLVAVMTLRQVGTPFTGHLPMGVGAFSKDGKILALTSDIMMNDHASNGAITLWDVATRQPIGPPLIAGRSFVDAVAFSPNEKMLATGGSNGTVLLWDLDTQSWLSRACRIANRNLTQGELGEWRHYFGDDPYRKTCSNLP
jgi:WD40 repeat protein